MEDKKLIENDICQKFRRTSFEDNLIKLADIIQERKVLIWGACERSKKIIEKFNSLNLKIEVSGYIDSNESILQYNSFYCYKPDIITKDKYFIILALWDRYTEIDKFLQSNKYEEYTDYIYFFNPMSIIKDVKEYYSDFYGNEIYGNLKQCNICFKGHNNLLVIEGNHTESDLKIFMSSESIAYIQENAKIAKLYDDNYQFIIKNKSVMKIGRNFTIYNNSIFRVSQNSMLLIGDDCLFSSDIQIQTSDSHNLYDLVNRENINRGKNYSVIIGNHVWIGRRVSLLYGTDIGSGSVVGINSLVNKKFPNNVIIAGNPAKIVRENVAWNRQSYPFLDDYEEYADFDFREYKT